MQKIRWFFLLFALLIVLLLMLWNSAPVTLSFPLMSDRAVPLSILLLSTSVAGFFCGAVVTGWMLRRRHKATNKAESKPVESPSTAVPGAETAGTGAQ